MISTVFILLYVTTTIKSDEHGVFFKVEENRLFIKDENNVVWAEKVDSLLSCTQMCARRVDCQSANFVKGQRTCSLLSKERTKYPTALLIRAGCFYLEKVGWKSFVSLILVDIED